MEIVDVGGALGHSQAPVCARLRLPDQLRRATAAGRLVALELTPGADRKPRIPVQLLSTPAGEESALCWMMPPGVPEQRVFTFEAAQSSESFMCATSADGQYKITQGSTPVLRYNYATVEPGALLKRIAQPNLKYAVARSDYIHPLYGPTGEELTKDWSVDHPHHRGIYWAWPEVDWHGQRGDLHALQKVFAHPTGKCEEISGPVFAEVAAENVWRWETGAEIVREKATIRAYSANPTGRYLDLLFQFQALGDTVSIARRDTSHYGGLNIRLGPAKDQQITKYTPSADSKPRPAWSDLSGIFPGSTQPAGLMVLQHAGNPDYPADWIDYPELNWVQPTFPAAGTRYVITKEKPLTLRFRLWIHTGSQIPQPVANAMWLAANSSFSPLATL